MGMTSPTEGGSGGGGFRILFSLDSKSENTSYSSEEEHNMCVIIHLKLPSQSRDRIAHGHAPLLSFGEMTPQIHDKHTTLV